MRIPRRPRLSPPRAAAALAAAALLLAGAGDEAMRPGAWERRTEFVSATQGGKPVPEAASEPDVRRRCVPPDAANAARLILPPPNADCAIVDSQIAGGAVRFSGRCNADEAGPLILSGTGTYDAGSYAVDIVTESPAEPAPVIVTMRVTARHVGECAPGDEPLAGTRQ
ncbi:hypothetical protein FHS96_000396 [Sphingomonas zeicaulis]|uniref:DUF3617 domain-containing protein n=1 Tax=Sphingomonas zeicaulis TaxID=1632740 RepID=UPI003D214311